MSVTDEYLRNNADYAEWVAPASLDAFACRI
jgi:hypothetical protein